MLFTKMPWVTEYSAVHNNEMIYYFVIQRACALSGRVASRHHQGREGRVGRGVESLIYPDFSRMR